MIAAKRSSWRRRVIVIASEAARGHGLVRKGINLIVPGVTVGFLVPYLEASSSARWPWPLLAPTIVTGLICVIPITYLGISKRLTLDEPLIYAMLAWFLFFFARPLYICATNDFAFLNGIGVNPYLSTAPAEWMAALSAFMFSAGYLMTRGRSTDRASNKSWPAGTVLGLRLRKTLRILAVISAVALIGFIYFLRQNHGALGYGANVTVDGTTAYIYDADLLLGPVLIVLWTLYLWRKLHFIWFLGFGAPIFWILFASGSRAQLIILGVAVVLVWLRSRELQGKKVNALSLIAILVFGIVLASWLGINRHVLTTAGFVGTPVTQWSDIWQHILGSNGDLNIFDTWTLVFAKRQMLPREYGFELPQIILQIIPRIWWPQKPLFVSQVYMKTLLPYFYYRGTGFAGSVMADWLMNFGIPGVAAGMLGLGMLCGEVYRWSRRQVTIGSVMVYAAFVGYIVMLMRGELVGTAVWGGIYILPLLYVSARATQRPPGGSNERTPATAREVLTR